MKNFNLREMTASLTAIRRNIENTPQSVELESMVGVLRCLQVVRDFYGDWILITSGYRSKELNEAVGGAKNSMHMRGRAADIRGADMDELLRQILRAADEMNKISQRTSIDELQVPRITKILDEREGERRWFHVECEASLKVPRYGRIKNGVQQGELIPIWDVNTMVYETQI